MMNFQCGHTLIVIKMGNLIDETGDAIVCPANSFGHMRGGVAGLIRQRGGDAIQEAVMAKAPIPVGSAIITQAGDLKVKYVIHAPTMRMPVQRADAEGVRVATRAALRCADLHRLHSVSFPGMGTGTGWMPYDEAADIMLTEMKRYLSEVSSRLGVVSIVAYTEDFYNLLLQTAHRAFGSEGSAPLLT
jgi:O-acetyl-ADP-ribose deacetylase (regulator of RNase III)